MFSVSGDSGSFVVNAHTGNVYGMIVAGSSPLQQEYIISAAEIGKDICRVMQTPNVRLRTKQDVKDTYQKANPDYVDDTST